MKKISIYLVLALIIAAPSYAGTYTVKKDGSGDYTSIQAFADAARAGDTCIVSGGTYSGVTISKSGTSGNRITFRADAKSSQPIITGNFNFSGSSYITVDGFYMDGGSFSGANCSFIEILNNTIDKTGNGINSIQPGDDILISGNTFKNLTNDVVNQWGRRWVIRNNIAITNINDINDEHLDFWQSWCGDTPQKQVPADYTLVENNLYADVSGGNVHFFLFHQTTKCGSDKGTNFIIRYNKVRNIGSNGVTFDNDSGAPGFTGVAIYNNVFGDLSKGSPASWQDYIGALDDTSGTASFLNNILYNAVDPTAAEAIYPTDIPADHTLAFDSARTITTDGALKNSTGSIVNQNPRFAYYSHNDFSLSSGSPAIDAGGPLTKVSTADKSSGTALVVDDPWFFQAGWAGADPDWIAVGSVTNAAKISSINYSTNTITLATSITRSDGDPVYLYRDSDGTRILNGSAPDIGAVEVGSGSGSETPPEDPTPTDPPMDLPGNVINLRIVSN